MITFSIILALLMVVVIIFDATRFIIPNWLNALVLLLYPLFVWLSPTPVDWMNGLYAFGVMFAVGMVLFALKVMGGGDIKLFIALSVWCGLGRPFLDFLVYTALYGGVLTLILIFLRPLAGGFFAIALRGKMKPPRIFKRREPIPYGLAIAASVFTLLFKGSMPFLPALSTLL